MQHSLANKELIVAHNPLGFDDTMAAGTSMQAYTLLHHVQVQLILIKQLIHII
jgi:hypothetical protein